MQSLPHLYSVRAVGRDAGEVSLTSEGLPALASAAPAQFDGPGDRWSPESLLAAAVAACFVLTFRSIARASQLQWLKLDCSVEAKLDRVEGHMQFTHVVTHVTLTVGGHASTVQCERALEKAETNCLIANSLRCKRELRMEIIEVPARPEANSSAQHSSHTPVSQSPA